MSGPQLPAKSTIRKRSVAALESASNRKATSNERGISNIPRKGSPMAMTARPVRSSNKEDNATANEAKSSSDAMASKSPKRQHYGFQPSANWMIRSPLLWAVAVVLPLFYWVYSKQGHGTSLADATKTSDIPTGDRDTTTTTILEEYRTLIELSIPPGALTPGEHRKGRYGKVHATFCAIDWDLQSANPSTVPMFKDLKGRSSSCKATKTVVTDFYKLARAARDYDAEQSDRNETDEAPYPSGVVFHETRCGSTLVANLLAGSSPTMGTSRVYSESPPPIAALQACARNGGNACDPDLHSSLIRDVFYVMGRRRPASPKAEQHRVFYKIQSIGSMSIDKFTAAFPTVPWIFVYRDTVEILQSHLQQGRTNPTNSQGQQKSTVIPKVCTRNYNLGLNRQPATTLEAMKDAGVAIDKPPSASLDPIEYCAAHLAGLSLAALHEHDRWQSNHKQAASGGGRFVEYSQLPDRLWNEILPDHFGLGRPLPEQAISNMETIAGVYSKGRGKKANQEWASDSEAKQETASKQVTEAAKRFASGAYERMKALSS